MFRRLIDFDREVFLHLNGMHLPAWDDAMWWISRFVTWIPLYIALLVLIIYRERPYRFILTLLFAAVTVALCDQAAALIEILVQRPRPTHEPAIASTVYTVRHYRGELYGFVSSQATCCFGAVAFLTNQLKHYKWSIFLFVWATVVSYSSIYLGVHYPLDIICGAVLGILIGTQCYVYKVWTAVYTERRIEARCKKKAAGRRAKVSIRNRTRGNRNVALLKSN